MKEKWQQLAEDLGFEYKEGIQAFTSSPRLRQMIAEDFPKGSDPLAMAEKFLKSPLVKRFIAKVFTGAIIGNYRDFEFVLYRSSSSSGSNSTTYYTNIVLLFPRDYDLGMQVTYAGFWGRLGKKLFPGNKVRLMDPELDRLLVVKAKNKTQAQTLLSSSRLKWKLLDMFRDSKNFKITDQSIRYKEVGHIIDKEKALTKMEFMVEAASRFY